MRKYNVLTDVLGLSTVMFKLTSLLQQGDRGRGVNDECLRHGVVSF